MKRVLLVTYYFPPSGGPGVQRSLKMAGYLPEFGWEPHVLTVDPDYASYPVLDPELSGEVTDALDITRTRARDPYGWYAKVTGRSRQQAVGVGFTDERAPGAAERAARWIRANLFLPDARRGWVPYARRAALKLHRERPFDAVITTGPPHSAHLVGYAMSKEAGVPWLADVRDAWPDPSYADLLPTTRPAGRWDRTQRNRVLGQADRRVAVTHALAKMMEKAVGRPFEVVHNGFDPADFSMGAPPAAPTPTFTLVHTGTLPPARNPEPLWDVLSQTDRWPHLHVRLIGAIDRSVRNAIERRNLAHRVDLVPYVPHSEAIREMTRAQLLLLPINRVVDAGGIVTGKIFEYLASSRPVLGLGDPTSEAASILRETGAGTMIAYEDPDALALVLDRHYGAWAAGNPLPGAQPEQISAYSRRTQTSRIARMLNDLLENHP